MSKIRKLLISAFILFTFLTMIRVHLPLEHKFFSKIYDKVDPYLDFFSIYQDWVMFSPNPARLDAYMSAEVEFDDGSKDTYTFPRNPHLPYIDKYVYGERFRKIIEESIRRDDHDFLWKDTAKFVLRKLKERNFHKVPLKVHLTRHWSETPDMEKQFIPFLEKRKVYESFKFYTYEVI